ncbi:LexA family transcriptional regulator [Serratia fonticola]|uniref:LexA family protein n=1 Tax=Serratia fonticola TaxID=47917 RepID=UPI003AAA467A
METIGQRIKRLRKEKKISQMKLGAEVGVSDVAVGYWEKDLNEPKGESLVKLAKYFGVSESYLLYGQEVTNVELVSSTLRGIPLLSWVQAGMFTESEYQKLLSDADTWIDSHVKSSRSSFALKVRGDSMLNPNGLPSIPEGAIIIVDPELQVEHGKIVVARIDGTSEVTVKKYVVDGPRKYLVPLNPRFENMLINGNCIIIGVVCGVQYEI